MKKIFSLLASCFLALITCVAFAWDDSFNPNFRSPSQVSEKIYLFDVSIDVQTDGSINITEDITLNAKHQKIRRGIYRDIPILSDGQLTPVSLTMDGQTHPFFTENKGRNLRINFGNDNYIPRGRHTYSFKYTYKNAIKFFRNYDELYWNITGNEWNFTIDKARVKVVLPSNARVQTEGISLYTGPKGAKDKNARRISDLTFETTRSLYPKEGFTIAIPFDKGVVQEPPFMERLKKTFSFSLISSIILFITLIIYIYTTWLKVGQDPAYMAITRYEPPKGVSPAFVYYLYNEEVDAKLMSCIVLDLAMKGYLEVKNSVKNFWGTKPAALRRRKAVSNDLPLEEIEFIRGLLADYSPYEYCVLDSKKGPVLNIIVRVIEDLFKKQEKPYIIENKKYILYAVYIVLAMGIIPFIPKDMSSLDLCMVPVLIMAYGVSFLFVSLFAFHKLFIRIISWFVFILISLPLFSLIGNYMDAKISLILYMMGLLCVVLYYTLIPNVTPKGRELFEELNGFKKYIKTAEVNRVAASNPLDAERIFCDYLPYAFAMGLQNKWMKKFTHILSKATIERCTVCVGGISGVSSGLSQSVGYSMGSGSGSFGGGGSGGGGGGGGGGGR
jgi:hypothetical protein